MRLLSTIVASISAVLCVAVLFFWARSYSYYEGIVGYARKGAATYAIIDGQGQRSEWQAQGRTAGLLSRNGSLSFSSIVDPVQETWSWFSWSHPVRQEPDTNAMALMAGTIPSVGFSVGSGKATVAFSGQPFELPYWRITVPYVLLTLLTAILPVRWFMNYRLMARREREGRCVFCGHDLHGQTTGNCAACGKPVD
jgi:hypothetical protein